MYKIIRCSGHFELVVAVSPSGADPSSQNAKYYRYASWGIGDAKADDWSEIGQQAAMQYFSGVADGLGFEPPPEDVFPSLEAASVFVIKKRDEAGAAYLREKGVNPDITEEVLAYLQKKYGPK